MSHLVTPAILGALVVLALWFVARWWVLEQRAHTHDRESTRRPTILDTFIGFVVNFFDTLGIGSFATTTAAFKLLRRVPDEQIPGTLNVGHALPVVTEALIFIAVVTVEPLTLVSMIGASMAGAWLGVGFISRLPRRAIQLGMGAALLTAAILILAGMLDWMPVGGDALGLAIGGIPGVLIAAYLVKSLPIDWLRWLVLVVVTYVAISMFLSARRDSRGLDTH